MGYCTINSHMRFIFYYFPHSPPLSYKRRNYGDYKQLIAFQVHFEVHFKLYLTNEEFF